MTAFLIHVFGINIRITVINLNAANFNLNIAFLIHFFFLINKTNKNNNQSKCKKFYLPNLKAVDTHE